MRRIKVRRERAITLSLLLGLSLAGLSLMLARPPMSMAATLTVTSTADSGPGTLRQAILDAASGDTITFSLPANSQITLLINAVKEQQAQIETLAAQIERRQNTARWQKEQITRQQLEIEALKKLVCAGHRKAAICKAN